MGKNKFLVVSDMTCDLPKEWYEENGAVPIPHAIIIDKVEYWDDFGVTLPVKQVYETIRNGKMPSTVQGNYQVIFDTFENACKEGQDAIYPVFSARLSGTYNTSSMIAAELMEKYPERKIICFDTRCASMGHGQLVMGLQQLADSGATAEEGRAWLEQNWSKMCHFFTVDDLNHLCRGGRLSKTSAVVGTVIGIKPIMYIDTVGALVPINKIRGRRQSMEELARLTAAHFDASRTGEVYVLHGDCLEDGQILGTMLEEKIKGVKVKYQIISPMIGVHAGPGTLATVFWGDDRLGK